MILRYLFLVNLIYSGYCGYAQNDLNVYRITSSFTSFPDTGRAAGHMYKNVLYDVAGHYRDSSVIIFSPKNLAAKKKVDIIFWFHGWSNNIDTTNNYFGLSKQFAASGLNAILVLAETTKNAPDSYGGKLERAGVFKNLVNDVLMKLWKERVIPRKCQSGNIILAGHSGAYRVMAHILQNGNMPVREVILFDALYGETNKYLNWIQSDPKNRLINIYTNGGGTDDVSREMVKKLIQLNIPVDTLEEINMTASLLQTQRIVVMHSLKKHNDVINHPDNFQLFLENSPFLKKIRK